jgi:hypothetical protein
MLENKKPIMYLDIDDTIIVWTNHIAGFAAPKADEFIKWALEHFEVRWLTMWTPSGELSSAGADELEYRFNNTISASTFLSIKNSKSFINNKTEAIDFDTDRQWVWVEDSMVYTEKMEMIRRVRDGNFYPTNVSLNVMQLQVTWNKLSNRFSLPGPPSKTYSKTIIRPTIELSEDELLTKFRNGKLQNHDPKRPADLTLPTGWNW